MDISFSSEHRKWTQIHKKRNLNYRFSILNASKAKLLLLDKYFITCYPEKCEHDSKLINNSRRVLRSIHS